MLENGPLTVGEAEDLLTNYQHDDLDDHDDSDEHTEEDETKLSEQGVQTLVTQIVDMGGEVKTRCLDIINKIARRSIADGFPVSMVRKRAFNAVVEEFRSLTLVEGPRLKSFKTRAQNIPGHTMSGKVMQKFAEKVLGRTPLTIGLIKQWGEDFRAEFGEYPNPKAGPLGLPDGEEWSQIEYSLRLGKRGLSKGSSLAKLFGYDKPDYCEEDILEWVDRCKELTGEFPHERTGPNDGDGRTPEDFGLPRHAGSWNAVNLSLAKGHRGLPGSSSLVKLLVQYGRIPGKRRSKV